jgi:hypothetical protein
VLKQAKMAQNNHLHLAMHLRHRHLSRRTGRSKLAQAGTCSSCRGLFIHFAAKHTDLAESDQQASALRAACAPLHTLCRGRWLRQRSAERSFLLVAARANRAPPLPASGSTARTCAAAEHQLVQSQARCRSGAQAHLAGP